MMRIQGTTKYTKYTKKGSQSENHSENDSFIFQKRVATRIDQESQPESRAPQIVMNLGAMFVAELRHRFDFEDDLPEAHEVRLIAMFQRPIFISQYKLSLRSQRNSTNGEFDLQALLINRFKKPRSLDLVDLKASPHDPITLIRKQDHNPSLPICPFFVYFVYFVVPSSLPLVSFLSWFLLSFFVPSLSWFHLLSWFYSSGGQGDERIDVEDERDPSVAEDAGA